MPDSKDKSSSFPKSDKKINITKATNFLKHNKVAFSTFINETIQNIRHTGALGVYTYLASKPEDWVICKNHLKKHFDCGRKHMDTCFRYLKRLGLVEIKPIKDERGVIKSWETVLHDRIHIKAALIEDSTHNTGFGHSGDSSTMHLFHNVENPQCGKGAPTNKRDIQIKEKLKIKETTTEDVLLVNQQSGSVSMKCNEEGGNMSESSYGNEYYDYKEELTKLEFEEEEITKLEILYAKQRPLLIQSIKHLVFDERTNKKSDDISLKLSYFFMSIMKKIDSYGNLKGYGAPKGFKQKEKQDWKQGQVNPASYKPYIAPKTDPKAISEAFNAKGAPMIAALIKKLKTGF